MTSSLVAALTSVRFVSQQFRALDNWYLNRRYILLITIGDKEDSKQSQQMPAENFNLQWNITFSKHLRQFATRIESPSLSVSYESCQYNIMLTIFAKVWLQMHARRLLSHKNLFYKKKIIIRLRLAKTLRTCSGKNVFYLLILVFCIQQSIQGMPCFLLTTSFGRISPYRNSQLIMGYIFQQLRRRS